MNFDLDKFLSEYNPKSLGKGEVVIRCPLCGKDKLTVNKDKGLWHCWVCQEFSVNANGRKIPVKGAGNIVSLVALLRGLSYHQANQLVGEGSSIPWVAGSLVQKESTIKIKSIDYPRGCYWVGPGIFYPDYCFLRGISLNDAISFRLLVGTQGAYNNCLIFPVFEEDQLVYFQARRMGNSAFLPKCLNPPVSSGVDGSDYFLFNLDRACFYSRVAIVEGPIDAVHCGEDAVCTFGKKISSIQIRKLIKFGVKAVDLMWDGPTEKEPEGAYSEMLRFAPYLASFFDVRVIYLPWGDPGDYSQGELRELRKTGISVNKVSRLACL